MKLEKKTTLGLISYKEDDMLPQDHKMKKQMNKKHVILDYDPVRSIDMFILFGYQEDSHLSLQNQVPFLSEAESS